MKKTAILLLCLTLLLCACGADQPSDTTGTPSPATQTTAAAEPTTSATDAPQAETTVPGTAAVSDKELAESCIDKDVSELYALIGEPASSEYVSSCLGDGEDGNLYYDGFTVYTYRDAEGETVTFVE